VGIKTTLYGLNTVNTEEASCLLQHNNQKRTNNKKATFDGTTNNYISGSTVKCLGQE